LLSAYANCEFNNQGHPYDVTYPWNYRTVSGHTPADEDQLDIHSVNQFIQTRICRMEVVQYSYFLGANMDMIDHCSTFNFCNYTMCVYFSPAVIAFAGRRLTDRGSLIPQNQSCLIREKEMEKSYPLLKDCSRLEVNLENNTIQDVENWKLDITNHVNLSHLVTVMPIDRVWIVPKLFKYNEDIVIRFHKNNCGSKGNTLTIRQNGSLPLGCVTPVLYNSTSRIFFNLNHNLLSTPWFPQITSCVQQRSYVNTLNGKIRLFPFNLPGFK